MKFEENDNSLPSRCPNCRALNSFLYHDSYLRNLCYVHDEKIITTHLIVQRLRCTSCNKTHALLPDDVVPYSFYAKSFVFHCLKKYYLLNESVSSISAVTNVPQKQIYRFLRRFSEEFRTTIIFLRVYLSLQISNATTNQNLFRVISELKDLFNFFKEYFLYSNKVFLFKERVNIISKKTLIIYHTCKILEVT